MLEAARIKGVSYHTVSRAVRSGKLKSRRSGRLVLVSSEDLNAWQPMRERAPLQYRSRLPEPASMPGVIDLASGERYELARRLSAIYEAIQESALSDPREEFTHVIAERFAAAMEFDRVAIWAVTSTRAEIVLLSTSGDWYAPGEEPATRTRLPFNPETMYASLPDVYDGISCWLSEPKPVRMGQAFSASMVANEQLIGYIIGDRNGEPFSLTPSQIELGDALATHFASIIVLRRSYDLEVIRHQRALEAANEYAGVVGRMARAFNQDKSLSELVRQAGRDATRVAGSHSGEVMLRVTGESVVRYLNRDGFDRPEERLQLDLSRLPGTMRALEAGTPLLIPWSEATEIERSHWSASDTRSCLTLPLTVDGELAGVMMIEFPDEHPELTAGQISTCETLAAACAAAIVKQRLHDALAAERAVFRPSSGGSRAVG